ncbi:MAG: hypothetical protein J6B75_05635 [Ruminococcus sp.]|nr:hypothetical protein [Ruminococcus sp.]
MRITGDIYNLILSKMPVVPPETGGIIGSVDDIICTVVFDMKNTETKSAVYVPDIYFLNECISEWAEDNIRFEGIFHSHPYGQNYLSVADVEYIEKIMQELPENINQLYFPIVFPKHEIISFRAEKSDSIRIFNDNMVVVNN